MSTIKVHGAFGNACEPKPLSSPTLTGRVHIWYSRLYLNRFVFLCEGPDITLLDPSFYETSFRNF